MLVCKSTYNRSDPSLRFHFSLCQCGQVEHTSHCEYRTWVRVIMRSFPLVVASLSFIIGGSYAFRAMFPQQYVFHRTTTVIYDGLFQSLFQPKKSATASHILVKGPEAVTTLTELKIRLQNAPNLQEQFSAAAKELSACPSGKSGGSLGKFKQVQYLHTMIHYSIFVSVGILKVLPSNLQTVRPL